MKIKAFTLRKKTSKAGKTYYVSPYGNVDLLGFEVGSNGDIEVSYAEREEKPAYNNSYQKPQGPPAPRPPPRPPYPPPAARGAVSKPYTPPAAEPAPSWDPNEPWPEADEYGQ